MKETIKEYIEYLSSLDNDTINDNIQNYNQNIITFEKLEMFAIENEFLSKKNYYKFFKIGNLLK